MPNTTILVAFIRAANDPDVPPADEFAGYARDMTYGTNPQLRYFDYVSPRSLEHLTESDSLPTPVDEVPVYTDTEIATEAIEWAWETTTERLTTHLQTLREALTQYDDEEILADRAEPEIEEDVISPCRRVRYAARRVGAIEHPDYRLYTEHGEPFDTRAMVDDLLEDVASDEKDVYVVPANGRS